MTHCKAESGTGELTGSLGDFPRLVSWSFFNATFSRSLPVKVGESCLLLVAHSDVYLSGMAVSTGGGGSRRQRQKQRRKWGEGQRWVGWWGRGSGGGHVERMDGGRGTMRDL